MVTARFANSKSNDKRAYLVNRISRAPCRPRASIGNACRTLRRNETSFKISRTLALATFFLKGIISAALTVASYTPPAITGLFAGTNQHRFSRTRSSLLSRLGLASHEFTRPARKSFLRARFLFRHRCFAVRSFTRDMHPHESERDRAYYDGSFRLRCTFIRNAV